MNPVLFEHAGIAVSAYPAMMALGAGVLLWSAWRGAGGLGLPKQHVLRLFLLAWIPAWFGARLFFVIEHRELLQGETWRWLIHPAFGGFSSYGGLLFGLLGAAIYLAAAKLPVARVLDCWVPGLCGFGIFARLGCYLSGCCYGLPTGLPWGVVFPADSPAAQRFGETVAVHPSQLYEIAVLGLIMICLIRWNSGRPGTRFLRLVVLYSAARLLLDPLRGDAQIAAGLFSTAQWLSLSVLLASAVLSLFIWRTRWGAAVSVSRN